MNRNQRISTQYNFLDQMKLLHSLIPEVGTTQHETDLYNFLHDFLSKEPPESLGCLIDSLVTIFQNREKWEVLQTRKWDEGGLDTFSVDGREISLIILRDLETCRDRNIQSASSGTSMTLDGIPVNDKDSRFSHKGSWRQRLVQTMTGVMEGHDRNPSGDPQIRDNVYSSIIGYVLSSNATVEVNGGLEPNYFGNEKVVWNRSAWQDQGDVMEVYVTATCSGHITNVHEDGPALDSMIWHVYGIKLWVVWDGTLENYEILKSKGDCSALSLEWTFNNLKDPKPGEDERRRMILPAGALHFVLSFTPCLALSSEFIREVRYDLAVRRAEIFKQNYMSGLWPEDERNSAKHRTEKGMQAWKLLEE